MIIHLGFMIVVLVMAVANYYLGRESVLYPPFIFAMIWFAVLSLYTIPIVEIDRLGTDTLTIVASAVAAFSLGAGLVPRVSSREVFRSTFTNERIKKLLLFYCLAMLPLFFLEIQRLSGAGGLESFLISARTALIDEIANGEKIYSSDIYTTAPMFATYCAFIFLIEMRDQRKERAWAWASILTALTFAILSTGRTWFLQLAVGLAGIYVLKSGRVSARQAWKLLRVPVIAFLVIFSILVPLTHEVFGIEGGMTDALTHYVFGYIVAPLAGFNYVVHNSFEYKDDANHTFRQVLPVLTSVSGIQFTPPPATNDFVETPFPTNVFTVFKFYYVDFGLFGMLVVMFLIGAGQTWLYYQAVRGSPLFIFLYAMLLFPLVMVPFDDVYSSMRYYVATLVFAIIYFRVLRGIPVQTKFWPPFLRKEKVQP